MAEPTPITDAGLAELEREIATHERMGTARIMMLLKTAASLVHRLRTVEAELAIVKPALLECQRQLGAAFDLRDAQRERAERAEAEVERLKSEEFERGRIAGINEAAARLALWREGYDEHGEPVPWADYAIKIVTALLPPVAPAGDREAVAPVGYTSQASLDIVRRQERTGGGIWHDIRGPINIPLYTHPPAQAAEERAVHLAWALSPGRSQIVAVCTSAEVAERYRSAVEQHHPGAVFHIEKVPLDHHFGSKDMQSMVYRAALDRARAGSEAQPS